MIRLVGRCWALNLTRELAYRASFVSAFVSGLAQLATALLTFWVLFRFTPSVSGWTSAQVLMLTGVYRIADGLIATFILRGTYHVGRSIADGDMDFVLLRPVSSQLFCAVRLVAWPELVNVAVGVVVAILAGRAADVHPTLGGLLAGAALLLCGLALVYCVFLVGATCCFWLVSDWVTAFVEGLVDTGRYPVTFFSGAVRALFTFAVPVAFISTFPVQAVLGHGISGVLLKGWLLAAAALVATSMFWRFAVRHYTSASS